MESVAMNENIKKFEKNWIAFNTSGVGNEAYIDLLIDLAKRDDEVSWLVKSKFEREDDDSLKLYLAMIAVYCALGGPYKKYLKEMHDWQDSDFEDI